MIIASAIKIIYNDKEIVFMGKRHHNCLQAIWDVDIRHPFEEVQGFVTSSFEFVDRYEAWEIAERNGQIHQRSGPPRLKSSEPRMLFSEDLW